MIQSPLATESIQSPPNDTTLTERIRTKLALVISDPRHIEIRVKDGIVTLSGQLRDSAQSRAASLITHRVDGVTNVVNKLTVGWGALMNGAASRPAARRPKPAKRVNGSTSANGTKATSNGTSATSNGTSATSNDTSASPE